MNTTIHRPTLGDFLQISFAPTAAAALSETNRLARKVRELPERLLSDDLRSDRKRVLGTHLSDLLAAHRDARAAGAPNADSELAEGLPHIDEELRRILNACRSKANDSLETQSRFLEQRYPADDTLSGHDPGLEDLAARPIEGGSPRTLGRDSLEALFTPATSPPMTKAGYTDRSGRPLNGYEIIALAGIGIPMLIVAYLTLSWDPHAAERAMRAKTDIVATIERVQRNRHSTVDGFEHVFVNVDLHGSIRNRADKPLSLLELKTDLYSCPERVSPLARCTYIKGVVNYPRGVVDLGPGLTGRFRDQVALSIPDVTGHIRATLQVVRTIPG